MGESFSVSSKAIAFPLVLIGAIVAYQEHQATIYDDAFNI